MCFSMKDWKKILAELSVTENPLFLPCLFNHIGFWEAKDTNRHVTRQHPLDFGWKSFISKYNLILGGVDTIIHFSSGFCACFHIYSMHGKNPKPLDTVLDFGDGNGTSEL